MSQRTDPWFKFYPSNWRGEATLRAVSMAARGLWIEMLCLMHEAEPRGHLLLNGRPVTDSQLASLAGVPVEIAQALLGELETAGTFSRTRAGVIYSRKMRRDTAKSAKQRANIEERWKKERISPPSQPTEDAGLFDTGNTKPDTKSIPKKLEARTKISDANASSGLAAGNASSDCSASSTGGASLADVRKAFEAWNELAARRGLPVARKLDDARIKLIRGRLKDDGLATWMQALAAVEASDLCLGKTGRGWRADLDWICSPAKWRKLLEGAYGPLPSQSARVIRLAVDPAEQQMRLQHFADTGQWPEAWGPRPKSRDAA